MKELFEFRLFSDDVERHLPALAADTKDIAIRVEVEAGAPLFEQIGKVDRALRAERGHGLVTAWRSSLFEYWRRTRASDSLLFARVEQVDVVCNGFSLW
jgi:hypothetical protein